MLKIFRVVFTLLLLIIYISNISFAYNSVTDKSFIVTAYYSPLSNQNSYITGSYNGDIRLNGGGKKTASGKKVFTGLLAGPIKYPFGTKIYFEGYGVGSIEDRGGAIVKAGLRGHEYDRIDIWMGYGDEGLKRAKKWGKRTIKGKIVNHNSKITLKFSENLLTFNLKDIKVNPEQLNNTKDIKILQENLKKIGLYLGKIDGEYESIKDTIIDFQLKNGIIKSKKQDSAGRFGPKTYEAILKKYGNKETLIKQKSKNIFKVNPKIDIILSYGEIRLNGDEPKIEEIKKVQELFKELGLYNGDINGKFTQIKEILINFQKETGIIKRDNDRGAGYFGEKTKSALVKYFENKEDNKINLTYKEKLKIDKLGKRIKEKIGKIAKKENKEEKKIVNNLIKEIDIIIQKLNKEKLILKLQYLKEIL